MRRSTRQAAERICRRSFGTQQLGRTADAITRAAEEAGQPILLGMSAQFDTWYTVRDWVGTFEERIDRAAFDKSLRDNPDVVCCFNHDVNFPLATHRGGTLKSSTDQRGLNYRAEIDLSSPAAQTAYSAVKRGDVQGASIAFAVVRDLWEFDREADTERVTILEARLFEHGPVLNPASPTTTADVEDQREDDAEEIVRSVEIKLRRGVELTPYDLSVLNRNSGQIAERLRVAEPLPNGRHEAADTTDPLAGLRSRLELASRVHANCLGGR